MNCTLSFFISLLKKLANQLELGNPLHHWERRRTADERSGDVELWFRSFGGREDPDVPEHERDEPWAQVMHAAEQVVFAMYAKGLNDDWVRTYMRLCLEFGAPKVTFQPEEGGAPKAPVPVRASEQGSVLSRIAAYANKVGDTEAGEYHELTGQSVAEELRAIIGPPCEVSLKQALTTSGYVTASGKVDWFRFCTDLDELARNESTHLRLVPKE